MRSRSGILIRYFHCCFTDKSDISIAYQQLCFSKTNSSQENQSYLWKDDNYVITIIVMQKTFGFCGLVRLLLFFFFFTPSEGVSVKGTFFQFANPQQTARPYTLHALGNKSHANMTNRRWIIVNTCCINPRRDAQRCKSPLASRLRGFPENPGMLKRSAGVSASPSALTWRNRRRGWLTGAAAWAWLLGHVTGKVNDNKKAWGPKRSHTQTHTGERPGTAHTFPAIQLLDCHGGSALPAGRAYRRVCVHTFQWRGLTVWRTLVSFHRDVFFRIESYTRLPLLYVSQSSLRARQWPCYGCKELCADQFSLFQVRVSKPP